jgi:peptide/nickel transport system substrate-binding protein
LPTERRPRSLLRLLALLCCIAIVAAACGGTSDDDGGGDDTGTATTAGGGGDDEGAPTPGGRVVYGLEAETTGGFCLPEAQLAIAGIQVARTIYDTLIAPNSDGEYVPYLAESVEPNDTFDQWTITLREGVKFHDGTDLTAEVVKNNLDAYRGTYPNRHPLLFVFVFANVADVQVVDPLTVSVTTKTPWPAFPAYLFSSGRLGIMGQAQLDDAATCDRNLIGTGPFKLGEWVPNDHLTATKNADYWQTDEDGNQLPYLDEIEYRPITEGAQRLNAIQAGEVSAMHTSGALQIGQLRSLAEAGTVDLVESDQYGEVSYGMLNSSKAPFDNVIARRAVAFAMDREQINEIRNDGINTIAEGPFAPGNDGFLEDTGFPDFDLDEAKALVAQYESETGQPLEFTLSSTPDPDTLQNAQLAQQMAEAAGMKVTLRQSEQSQLINEAIAGDFQAVLWRNHPGGDPDGQYVWWHTGSPVNFGRIDDTEVDRLLDEGRTNTDPDARVAIYEDLNRRFADQAFNIWLWYTLWAVATSPDVHGVMGPPLPDGSDPFPGLATGHPVLAMWVEQ